MNRPPQTEDAEQSTGDTDGEIQTTATSQPMFWSEQTAGPSRTVEEVRDLIRIERVRGLDDRSIAAVFSGQSKTFPPPPAGFPHWTAHAVRTVMAEVSA